MGDWGTPHSLKNWLAPPCPLALFCPQNVDIVIFMPFFGHFAQNVPTHKSTPNGKPSHVIDVANNCHIPSQNSYVLFVKSTTLLH